MSRFFIYNYLYLIHPVINSLYNYLYLIQTVINIPYNIFRNFIGYEITNNILLLLLFV